MGLVKIAVLVAAAAFTAHFLYQKLYPTGAVKINGTAEGPFKGLEDTFRSNFEFGWEKEGASFVVFKNGKKVVDLWGGNADKQAAREWKEDTLTFAYSSTKAVAGLCIAILADRGRLKYTDLVSKHWPEFAQNGKANVTVDMVMAHQAGVPYLDGPLSYEDVMDHKTISKLLEEKKPSFPPGTDSKYHALTIGWLADQLIRRTDEKKRGIGQFLREEVAGPKGIDFHIGLPTSEAYRVARINPVTIWDALSEGMTDYRLFGLFAYVAVPDPHLSKQIENLPWVFDAQLNNPDYYVFEQAGGLGLGNARSLAELFNQLLNGKLVSSKTLDQLQTIIVNSTDMGMKMDKGHGFMYTPLNRAGVPYLVGHAGMGCQQVVYDRKNNIVIAYTTNGMKVGAMDFCRTYARLQSAVYDVAEKL